MGTKEKKSILKMEPDELRQEIRLLRRAVKSLNDKYEIGSKKLEETERKKYLSLFDTINDSVVIYDAITYTFLHCNDSFLRRYGYSRDEAFKLTPFDLHHPDDFETVRENIDVKSGGKANKYTHFTADRKQLVVEVITTDVYFDGQAAWMSVIHDVTDRDRMEQELYRYKFKLEDMINERTLEVLIANKKLKQEILDRHKAEKGIIESEKKFRGIIEKFLDGVVLVDENGVIIEWNQAMESIYGVGRAQVMGKAIWDVRYHYIPPDVLKGRSKDDIRKVWLDFFKTGKNPSLEGLETILIRTSSGETREIQQMFFPIQLDKDKIIAGTTRDVTNRLNMERQLLQAQKMEAVGTLAGGIAHDFNNILAGIMGYTDLSIRKTDADSPIMKYLQQVLTASRRAADLVKQMLTFSRPDRKEKEPLRLSSIVKEALKLMRSSLPATIRITVRIEAEESFVLADPTQLHQVIMNLGTNAGHAMKENGGVMEVRMREEMIEDGTYKELKPGPHIRLSFSDTGYGIDEAVLDKIFDPFFTTKKPGEGTGMGLSVVHGIIKNHNGTISVYSKKGQGTTFSILLPVTVNVIHKNETPDEEIPCGSERILLVEDEEPLAAAEKIMLEELGYQVTVFNSSVEALEIFQKIPNRFDLIVTDYTMPRLTGEQLVRKIRPINPHIPVILCTGHSNILSPETALELGIKFVIMKPIELDQFARAIRKALTVKEK